MKINKYKENCFSVENFISDEECDAIIGYLEWLSESKILEWNQISFYDSYAMGFWEEDPTGGCEKFGLPKNYFHGVLKEKIKNMGAELIGRDISEVSYHGQKWLPGAFAAFHSDNSNEDGTPSEFIRSKYAGFIYLNDDFEGGFLNFKHHDIKIYPKKGMLAFFAGGHTDEHEVTKVHGNTRFTVGSFWDNADAVYTEEEIEEREEKLKITRKQQDIVYKEWDQYKKNGISPDYVGKYGEV